MSENRVQDAEYHYYRTRLDDPGLLDRAVITEEGYLAVPAGGKRLGGEVSVKPKAAGTRLIALLAARPDEFPDPRLVRGEPWSVTWGPEHDWRNSDTAATGRYLGYSEAAIAAFERKLAMLDAVWEARRRVHAEMLDFEEACHYGLDILGAMRRLNEAVGDYCELMLRGTVAGLQSAE